MSNYKSRVVSLRIDPELLDAVRERAKAEGRSVSGEIVYLVRENIERGPEPRPVKKISGWLAGRRGSLSRDEFRQGRREAGKRVQAAIRRRTRAR